MNRRKWIFGAVMIFAVMSLLTACGSSFDPVGYIQGTLDAVYHGEIDEDFVATLEDVDSVEAFEAKYAEIIDGLTKETLAGVGVDDADEELTSKVRDLYTVILKATKYEVTGKYSGNEEEGYKVEVVAYPLETFNKVLSDEDGTITQAIEEKITADNDISTEELMKLYLEEMVAKMQEAIGEPTYGEEKSFELTVELNEDGAFDVDEAEFEDFTTFLLGSDIESAEEEAEENIEE